MIQDSTVIESVDLSANFFFTLEDIGCNVGLIYLSLNIAIRCLNKTYSRKRKLLAKEYKT